MLSKAYDPQATEDPTSPRERGATPGKPYLSKAYNPGDVEDRIYRMWEEAGAFTADAESAKEAFTISMPPPNATGELHLGHAVMLSLEDILIRFARMRGFEALWLPGTDHASIATESVVIQQIQAELKIPDPRASLGREELLSRITAYVAGSRGRIRGQIRKMGASCDWSRERYTLEPALSRCVNEVFVRMCREGLIYRGHRIVNWDPAMQTTVSDDETEWVEERSPFYVLQYGPFQIGTARPETKFGDKVVVMHPDDERYQQYKHGDTFVCEWINGPIKATVIKDKAVDPTFGTGVMTITPWHDAADFEIAERHELPKEQIIAFDGRLLSITGEFAGMRIEDARPKIVQKLQRKGLLVKEESDYVHRIARNYRGGGVIEPQIKEQWFIDVNSKVVDYRGRKMSLKEVLQETIRSGEITIIPKRFEKVYFHWVDNLRDWCISRQIYWGHRIPVWCKEGDCAVEVHVGIEPPEGVGWKQDPDTLDTWFSSGLWTWSTLIDRTLAEDMSLSLEELMQRSGDFQKFHPTTVLETGYDILFFWVARMILMTVYATGHIPFKMVYLHGLVRTREGKKMSKSDPESIIDPIDMIAKYGADALRLSMIVGQSPGNDFRLYEEKIAGYRNFVNKLWNAARFVLLECEKAGVDPKELKVESARLPAGQGKWKTKELSLADRALLSELQTLIDDVTKGLEAYRLSEVGERLYSFLWDFFCDWYLELSKEHPNLEVLLSGLRTILKLLHPYSPFVTEELWTVVKHKDADMLIKEPWPESDRSLRDHGAQEELQVMIDVIKAIRKIRTDYGVDRTKTIDVIIHTDRHLELMRRERVHIMRFAGIRDWTLDAVPTKHEHSAGVFLKDIEVHVPLKGTIDLAKERTRLQAESKRLQGVLKDVQGRLADRAFTERAPVDVVEDEKAKEQDLLGRLQRIEEQLKVLS